MKNRFFVIAGLALAVTAVTPSQAKAVDCAAGIGSVQPGFGGFFSDCWAGFRVTRVFENALAINNISWFDGMPTRAGALNSPTPGGTFLFDNNCGSNGANASSGALCTSLPQVINWNGSLNELVFGLQNPAGEWIYTGIDPNRNTPPTPGGVQNFIWQVTGTDSYLLGWEDLNSGCTSNLTSTQVDPSILDDKLALGSLLASCNPGNINGGNTADNDYNDFYMLIEPLDLGEVTEIVPEPLTMTLLATGLAGLGGASLRRRRK